MKVAGVAYYVLSQECQKCGHSHKERSRVDFDDMTPEQHLKWLRCQKCGSWAFAGAKPVYKNNP